MMTINKKPEYNMLRGYIIRLILRICVFGAILWTYIVQPHYFDYLVTKTVQLKWQVVGFELSEIREIWNSQYSVIWMYAVWALFMLSMLNQMFVTKSKLTMGAKKVFYGNYVEAKDFSRAKVLEHKNKQDLGAIKTLIAWSCLNAVFGALYALDIIAIKELVLLTAFYYICDLICVVIFCPFQRFFMKNRCCVNCRIFNWGYIMIFTPFLFIRNFFTWSLFFMSLLLVIRWEVTLLIKPERFWDGSNEVLRCENCEDKICKIKGAQFYDEAGKLINKKH